MEFRLLLISAMCAKLFRFCSYCSHESGNAMERDISLYSVLLKGEGPLPEKTLRNLCKEADKLMKLRQKKQPDNLINLLKKSVNLNGVSEFDSKHIQSLHSHPKEPSHCWSLPIVTLTTIATALPNITDGDRSIAQLVKDVSKGLDFASTVEKALNGNGELVSIRSAADIVWIGVEQKGKWQDVDIQLEITRNSRSYKDVLQKLSDVGKNTVGDFIEDDPASWPIEVISANAMYRISQTIMQAFKDGNSQTKAALFEKLSIMIADILSACLTNLGRAIALNCHSNIIEEREERVHQSAILVGESEDILTTLKHRASVLPRLDARKAAYIEEWRTIMEQDCENPEAHVAFPTSDGVCVIELEGLLIVKQHQHYAKTVYDVCIYQQNFFNSCF